MNKNGEKLDKYCLVSSGGTPSKKNLSYYENGSILWATIADMEKSDGIVLETKLKITEKGLSSIGNRIFPKDTLFLAMYGSVGKVAIAGKEMAVNQAILGIQPKNENEIFIPYLKYWLMHNKPKIVNKARGGILKNLSAKIVKNIKIELPSYSDQKKIANLLTQVETLIAKREESIELLDELLRSSFLDMFGDPILNDKGWEMDIADNHIDLLTGYAFKSKKYSENKNDIKLCGGLIILPTGMEWDKANHWNKNDTNSLEKYWLKVDDIIMAMDRPWINSGFKIYQIKKCDPKSLLVQRTARIRSNSLNLKFLYFLFKQPAFFKQAKITETTVPHISSKDIRNYKIFIPPKPLQDKFATIVKQVESTKEQYQKSLNELRDLFGSLSQRAFRGELEFERKNDDKKRISLSRRNRHNSTQFSPDKVNIVKATHGVMGVAKAITKVGNLSKTMKYSSRLKGLAVSNSIKGIGSIGTTIDFIKPIGANLPSMGTKLSPLLKMNSFGNKMNTLIGNRFLTKEKLNKRVEEVELIVRSVPNLNDAFDSKILSIKDFGELYIDATYDDIKELVYKLLDKGKLEQLFDEDKKRVVLKKVEQ